MVRPGLALLIVAALRVPPASACIVETADYCVTCKTPAGVIVSTLEADWCPGGDAGLVLLKGLNQGCQVNYMSPDLGTPHQPNCGVRVPKPSAAKGIGPYDLRSPEDRLVAFSPMGSQKFFVLAYRPGTGAAIVVEIRANKNDATFHSTPFARPATGAPPFGIGSFDLRRPEDRVIAIKDDLLLAYRPGSGNAAVVQFKDGNFNTVYSGMGIGGFDLMGANDQVVALAPNLLLAYRPGSGNSAVVSFADGGFHSPLQTSGIGSFDLRDGGDRIIPLGDSLALAYRPGPGVKRMGRSTLPRRRQSAL